MTITANQLESWSTTLLEKWGYSPGDAAYIASSLVDANSRGVDSHGVIRLSAYEKRVAAGLVSVTAKPTVEITGSVVSIDAAGCAGQLAAREAVEQVAALSTTTGVATATVRGSAHFGTAGFYARDLARRGKIAIVTSNSEPIVVPFGGKDALLGTNPFAFAAPSTGNPISLDMATSTSAMGKVLVAQAAGTPIPNDWGVDVDGNPTTDPNAVSALLPAAGPKGYGLGFLVEILAGVLSGAAVAGGIGNMYNDFSTPQDVGHWILAMDIERFMPLDVFTARMDSLIAEAQSVAPAPGFQSVMVPGQPEEAMRVRRLDEGIPLADATIAELQELGDRFSAPFPTKEASA